ncbi:MAG: vWA domain-containing protein, partial [Trebonia sp.]
VLVPPTTNTRQLLGALPGLTVGGATAIGDGILASLDAIAQADPTVAPTGAAVKRDLGAGYADAVIVVLTDGSNNRGVAPPAAAKEAAARGVRVFTIGYGTDTPAALVCGSGQFGGFGGLGAGGAGGGNPFQADYAALQQIAKATGGTFFRARDSSQLNSALGKLPAAFTVVHRQTDIAAAFAGLGGLLVAAAVALSLWWNRVRLRGTRGGHP